MPCRTIHDVIERLASIIAETRSERSRLGYFPALYLQVTKRVQQGIEGGDFDDGARMERLDVIFANRYFEAFDRFRASERPTRAWRVACRAASDSSLLILQHLLLGMNAHINLDLGLATAEAARGEDLGALAGDFGRIGTILESLLDDVQAAMAVHSPIVELIDRLGGQNDEALMGFSIRLAREAAWRNAQLLHLVSAEPFLGEIAVRTIDAKAEFLGKLITLAHAAEIDAIDEDDDVRAIIDTLSTVVASH